MSSGFRWELLALIADAVDRPAANSRAVERVGDVRAAWSLPTLAVVCAPVFAALVYVTSYKNFFYDEWDFVTGYRPGGSMSLLAPHNEHWSTIPILLWKLLFAVFGIRTHIPFEMVALASHIACVGLLFIFIRRHSGELPAFAAALVLLVLGAGAADIVWAFQLAWTLSIAFGFAAMLAVETGAWSTRRRVGAIAILLVCSLMSSSIGLGFLVAVGVELAVDRARRPLLAGVAIPLVIYAAWFAVFAAGIPGTPGGSSLVRTDVHAALGPGYVGDVASFLWWGLAAAAAGLAGVAVSGVPVLLLRALFVGVAALLAWHWYSRGRTEPWEAGLAVGLLGQYLVIAIARARYGILGGTDSHYVYVGAVFLLPLVAGAVKDFSWRWMWRPVIVGSVAICVLNNAVLLTDAAVAQRAWMAREDTELRVVELMRGAPDMALDQPLDPQIMPQLTAAKYYAAIDELGSPVPSSTPDTLAGLDPESVDRQMVTLFGGAVEITPGNASSASCYKSALPVTILVTDGQRVFVKPSATGMVSIALGYRLTSSGPLLSAPLDATTGDWIRVPDTGKALTGRLTVSGPEGDVEVCGAA